MFGKIRSQKDQELKWMKPIRGRGECQQTHLGTNTTECLFNPPLIFSTVSTETQHLKGWNLGLLCSRECVLRCHVDGNVLFKFLTFVSFQDDPAALCPDGVAGLAGVEARKALGVVGDSQLPGRTVWNTQTSGWIWAKSRRRRRKQRGMLGI